MRQLRQVALIIGIAGVLAGSAVAASSDDAQQSRSAITCTNPVSGASWRIVIDYQKSTVDSYPAEITRDEISWFDARDGGNYTLDRKSGNLTASVASSTGGYFRHGRCALPKAR
jgi:hypothetical protein